jgi:hypothetical protein
MPLTVLFFLRSNGVSYMRFHETGGYKSTSLTFDRISRLRSRRDTKSLPLKARLGFDEFDRVT